MTEQNDVEVAIEPSRLSRQNGFDLGIRKVLDSVTGTGWTLTDLTNANLRKVADAIYAHLGIEVSDDSQTASFLRGVEEGRASEHDGA